MIEIKDDKLIKTIENFDPKKWWLVCEAGEPGAKELMYGFWSLNRKIDRSYKGKSPDVGISSIIIDDKEEFDKLLKLKIDIIWI